MEKMKLDIQLFNGSVAIQTITETTDIDTNQSTFTIPAKMTTSGATYNNSNASMTLQWKYASASSWTSLSKQTFKIGKDSSVTKSWTLVLTHDPDGTLENVQFRVSWYITDSTKGTTGATTFAPTTIPRKSAIQSITSGTTDFAPVLKWTPASSTFKFIIRYLYGNWTYQTGWITPNSTSQQTYNSYTITGASIAPYMTNTTTAQVLASLYTYTSDGQLVGDSNVYFNVTLNNNIVPSVSFSNVSEAGSVPSSWGIYVKSKSKVALALSASGIYGSSISSYRISYYGGAVTTASATTSFLTQAGNTTFTGQVTDTRGRTASVTRSINVVDYSNPTISTAQVQRCDANGNIDNNGEYMYISYGASIASCSNKNTPNAVYKVGYRVHNTGSYQYVSLTTNANSYSASGVLFTNGIKTASSSGTKVQFSTSNTYDIQFYVKDYFMEYTNVQSLDAGFDLLNFNPSGKSMAIGKVSEASSSEEKLEIALDTTIDSGFRGRGCIVGQGGDGTSNSYYKFAEISLSASYNDRNITFKVYTGYADATTKIGILTAHVRLDGNSYWQSGELKWEYANSGIDTSKFIYWHNTSTNPTKVELYVKCDIAYQCYHFDCIGEGDRGSRQARQWTLIDNTTTNGGVNAIPTSGANFASSLGTLENPTQKIATANRNTSDTWIPVIRSGYIDYTTRYIPNAVTTALWNTEPDRLVTLAFMAFWNGAYSGTSSNLQYCYQGTIQAKPVSLYDNSSGATGNITLSETSANFTYLEIFYKYYTSAVEALSSTKIFSPNGKTAMLMGSYDNGTNLYHEVARYTISGTAVNRNNAIRWRFGTSGSPTRTNTTSSDQSIRIVKVIGYK